MPFVLTDADARTIAARLGAGGPSPRVVRRIAASVVAVLAVEPGEWLPRTPLFTLTKGFLEVDHAREYARPLLTALRDTLHARGVVEWRPVGRAEHWRIPPREER